MDRTGHILLLHHSEGERMRFVADWFAAGLASEDKLFYVDVAGWGVEKLTDGLAARGLHVDFALGEKRLEFVSLEDMLDLGVRGGLCDRALVDEGFPGVRLAVRGDAVAQVVSRVEHIAVENELEHLCHEGRMSVLCQYDGRTTQGPDLTRSLDLHPDWVYEADLSLRRRERLIRVEGTIDTLDDEVLARSLDRMTLDLPTDEVLVLDLRNVQALTAGAGQALMRGTRAFRDRGGRVRCGLPAGDSGRLLSSLAHTEAQFELA
jgi:hypothetical protein